MTSLAWATHADQGLVHLVGYVGEYGALCGVRGMRWVFDLDRYEQRPKCGICVEELGVRRMVVGETERNNNVG